jgi:hypothetical protein
MVSMVFPAAQWKWNLRVGRKKSIGMQNTKFKRVVTSGMKRGKDFNCTDNVFFLINTEEFIITLYTFNTFFDWNFQNNFWELMNDKNALVLGGRRERVKECNRGV